MTRRAKLNMVATVFLAVLLGAALMWLFVPPVREFVSPLNPFDDEPNNEKPAGGDGGNKGVDVDQGKTPPGQPSPGESPGGQSPGTGAGGDSGNNTLPGVTVTVPPSCVNSICTPGVGAQIQP